MVEKIFEFNLVNMVLISRVKIYGFRDFLVCFCVLLWELEKVIKMWVFVFLVFLKLKMCKRMSFFNVGNGKVCEI